MRLIALILLLAPVLVYAADARVELDWQPAEFAAEYEMACGFAPDALAPVATTAGTAATADLPLPNDAGTVYCGVTALSANGVRGDMSNLLSADYAITDRKPGTTILIEIRVSITGCPEASQCDVTIAP